MVTGQPETRHGIHRVVQTACQEQAANHQTDQRISGQCTAPSSRPNIRHQQCFQDGPYPLIDGSTHVSHQFGGNRSLNLSCQGLQRLTQYGLSKHSA